jgi:hypothetical protein
MAKRRFRMSPIVYPKLPKMWPNPGLPDGIFSYQKGKLWYTLEGLGMENFDAFHGRLVFFDRHFGIFYGRLFFGTSIPILDCCTKTNLAIPAQPIFI